MPDGIVPALTLEVKMREYRLVWIGEGEAGRGAFGMVAEGGSDPEGGDQPE